MKPVSRPRNAHVCPFCDAMVVLHARLPKGVALPCRSCGRSFRARVAPRMEAPSRKADPARSSRREYRWMLVGVGFGLAAAGGLLGPALAKAMRVPEPQWEVETERQGRQAVFSLYGTAPDEIDYVRASTRDGAMSKEGGWTRWKGAAAKVGDGRGPLALRVEREGETWEISVAPGGRSRACLTRGGATRSIYEGTARRVH